MASKPKYNPVTKRWRFWWHATFKDGTVYKGSKTFKTKAEAYRHKKIVESKIRLFKKNPPAPSPLFSVAVKTWLDHCRQFSKDTQKLYRSHTGLFAAAVCKDDPLVKSIKDRDLMAYLAGLQSKGLKSSTINNHRRSLKSFFKFTSQRFSIPNPAIDVERYKERSGQPKFINEDEYKRLLAVCSEPVLSWVRFLASTGLRASEFCSLTWRNYDKSAGIITVLGKGGKVRSIGLNKTALQILKDLENQAPTISPDEHIFKLSKSKLLTRSRLYYSISAHLRNASLPGGPHVLRHFFATQLLLRGVPIIKVSHLLGHSSVITTQAHYSHIISADLADATRVLDSL